MQKRNSAATKDRILRVAIDQFAEHGFATTGVRKIAKLAKCDPALIGRYYDSKEGLYRAVLESVSSAMDISVLESCDRCEWPAVLAQTLLRPEARTATKIYIRGVANPDTAQIFHESIMRSFVEPLSKLIGADGLRKAQAINAIVIGYATNSLMGDSEDLELISRDVMNLIEEVLSSDQYGLDQVGA